MAEGCLTKSKSVIKVDGIKHDHTVDDSAFLKLDSVNDHYYMEELSFCLEELSANEMYVGARAIIGMQAILKDVKGNKKYPPGIGNMSCEDSEYGKLKISGKNVGWIKMNFEQDSDHGVAIKFRSRDDQLLWKTGVRDSRFATIWDIPDDEELIGFHGKEAGSGINKKIVELGIVTRKKKCPV